MNCDPIKAWRGNNLWSFRIFPLCIFIGPNELLLRCFSTVLLYSTVFRHPRVRWNSEKDIINEWAQIIIIGQDKSGGAEWTKARTWTHRSCVGGKRWKFRWRTCVLLCVCVRVGIQSPLTATHHCMKQNVHFISLKLSRTHTNSHTAYRNESNG